MLPEEEENNNNIRAQYVEHVAALHAIAEAEDSFLNTIGHLNLENRKLEHKINEADAQNNLLQMQLRVLMQKMENLEAFMIQLNDITKDEDEISTLTVANCPKCGYNLKSKPSSTFSRSGSMDREVLELEMLEKSKEHRNPMMIDLVVAKIMDYLPKSTLLKCRRVSHLWNGEACYQLQRKNTFTLGFSNIDSINKFIENPSSCESLFTKLRIDVGFVIKLFRPYLDEFFKIFGPQLTFLSINCEEEFSNRIYTEELRNLFLGNLENIEELELSLPTKITERPSLYEDVRPRNRFIFPNLKSLTLNQIDNAGGYGVFFTKEILKMAPNLQSLKVETHNKEVMTRVLLALGDRECRMICSHLQHLYLDAYVTQQHLEMLSQFDFQLKSLQLSYLTVEVTNEGLESFLARHKNSLESLILGDYQKRPSPQALPLVVRLPELRILKVLKFVDPCFPDQRNLILNPLNYTVQLPALKKLEFYHESGKPSGVHLFSDLFNTSPTPCSTLEDLKISHGLTDPALIIQAAKMFPGLIRLDAANLADNVLQEVWNSFEQLVDLRLELCPGNVNVDSLLTGIPNEVCKKIQERNLYSQVEVLGVLDIIRTEPSICNLTKLRSLRIDGIPSTLLTAVSGYLALSQIKSLTSVAIKSDVATISRECRRVMGERLKLTLFELF